MEVDVLIANEQKLCMQNLVDDERPQHHKMILFMIERHLQYLFL